jgi:hypothetical protein
MVIVQFGAALWYQMCSHARSHTFFSQEVELLTSSPPKLLQVRGFLRSLLPAVPDGHRSNRAAPLIADHNWNTRQLLKSEKKRVVGWNRLQQGKNEMVGRKSTATTHTSGSAQTRWQRARRGWERRKKKEMEMERRRRRRKVGHVAAAVGHHRHLSHFPLPLCAVVATSV